MIEASIDAAIEQITNNRVLAKQPRMRLSLGKVPVPLSFKSCRGCRSPDHFAAEIRAPTAFLRTWTAQGMLRRMALAHLRTLVANLRAEPAQRLGSL